MSKSSPYRPWQESDPIVRVAVTEPDGLNVTVFGVPYKPPGALGPLTTGSFGPLIDHLWSRLRAPFTIEIVKTDGTRKAATIDLREPTPVPPPSPPPAVWSPAFADQRRSDSWATPSSDRRRSDAWTTPSSDQRSSYPWTTPSSDQRSSYPWTTPSSDQRRSDAWTTPGADQRRFDAWTTPSADQRRSDAWTTPSSDQHRASPWTTPSSDQHRASPWTTPSSDQHRASPWTTPSADQHRATAWRPDRHLADPPGGRPDAAWARDVDEPVQQVAPATVLAHRNLAGDGFTPGEPVRVAVVIATTTADPHGVARLDLPPWVARQFTPGEAVLVGDKSGRIAEVELSRGRRG
jgi:hypothetical protein